MYRYASAFSALLLALAAVLTGATSARAAAVSYAALGDSYSSGLGAGAYESGAGACKRSSKAYPELWAAAHHPSSFVFAACSGATTGDVTAGQLARLSSSTGLVSISVGGDDAGFPDVMTTCVTSLGSTCLDRIAQARAYVRDTLPGRLDTVYSAIRAKAPNARVVVLGYPRLYQVPGDCLLGLGDTERSALDGAADFLDTTVAARAAAHGFAFADVRHAFAGHELCSKAPWLRSVTLPPEESYHPTQAGQSGGYLPVFTAAA
jgi:hypothetical protein